MRIELTKEQIDMLLNILNQIQIRGDQAEMLVELKKALRNPIKEKKINKDD